MLALGSAAGGGLTAVLACYPGVGKKKGLAICEAFAAGVRACGGLADVQPPGTAKTLQPGAAFFYGTTPDNAFLLDQARREGRTWFYADNAYYFGRGHYFRVTRGALQHHGRGDAGDTGADRLRRFDIALQPWQRDGRHVIVATQSDLWHQTRHGADRQQWANGVRSQLRTFTGRPVELCLKPEPLPDAFTAHHPQLETLLAGAWAIVIHSSSAGVAALIRGVPVVALADCCASPMARRRLDEIETPAYPDDRERWLGVLAANQWTIAEMRDGTAWRMLSASAESAA